MPLRLLSVLALALAALTGCSSSGSAGLGSGGTATAAGGAGGASSPGGVSSPGGASSATGFDGALLPAGQPTHEFTLTDQDGRSVSLRQERGRVTILAFLYTASRSTAPLIAQQIRGALDELGSEPRPPTPALAISLDPAGDTPARVRAFLRATSLSGRMEYLAGTAAQLRPVWRAYSVAPASAGAVAYERRAFVLLLDKEGAPRVEFPVEELTPEALAHDVRRLERE